MAADPRNSPLLARLADAETRHTEAALKMGDPAVVADLARFAELGREYSRLGAIVSAGAEYKALLRARDEADALLASGETDPDLRALARDDAEAAEAALPALEQRLRLMLIPPDPEDDRNAILEIRAGTGGDEAALFAGDLLRMYARYCEARGWQFSVTSVSEGAMGGYKEVVAAVASPAGGVYGALKREGGVHRVQRVPATETQGRVHTSAATVAVLPEALPVDVDIRESDIRWDTFRSSGAGGQNVNKVESGVRLRYPWTDPDTGATEEILIECTETRDQPKNKERALQRLRALVYDRQTRRRHEAEASRRRSLVSTGDRSAKIRTYNFPQGRITDHRINFTTHNLAAFMAGDIQPMLDRLALADDADPNT